MDGLLLVDKDQGWTSFDVVAKVRSITKAKRVGHTGTLDPLATGLLVLAIGSATKRVAGMVKVDKTYEVELKMGETSTTGDEEGDKSQVSRDKPTHAEIDRVLTSLVGTIKQAPPAYSAIKVKGIPAYKLARKGMQVELAEREVTIHAIEDVDHDYPFLRFTTRVSSGTYIRSLAEDIGEALGVGAYVTRLRRTRVGEFDVKDAIKIGSDTTPGDIANNIITID